MIKLIKDFKDKKQSFLNGFDTKDFTLDIEKYTLIDNTYKVDINYNFKLPYIYSDTVIDEVYRDGTVNEDRLIIEYMMLTIICIKDINNGNFATRYLVEFAKSLYKKAKKIRQTLRVIDNVAIQDKIILKVTYQDFEENKDLIYSLMQEGFNFAIIINDDFHVTDTNLRKLNLFKYMLVPETCKNYDEIKNREITINNTIIYDV